MSGLYASELGFGFWVWFPKCEAYPVLAFRFVFRICAPGYRDITPTIHHPTINIKP